MAVTTPVVKRVSAIHFDPQDPRMPLKPRRITDGQMTAAEDDNTSVSADVKTAQFEIEVGEDTPLADAVFVLLGQPIRDSFIGGQTTEARMTLDLENGADSEAAAGTEIGFGVHKDPNVADDNALSMTDHDLYDGTASTPLLSSETPAKGVIMNPAAKEGEFIVGVTRSPSSQTLELANHILDIPVMVWDGREV